MYFWKELLLSRILIFQSFLRDRVRVAASVHKCPSRSILYVFATITYLQYFSWFSCIFWINGIRWATPSNCWFVQVARNSLIQFPYFPLYLTIFAWFYLILLLTIFLSIQWIGMESLIILVGLVYEVSHGRSTEKGDWKMLNNP